MFTDLKEVIINISDELMIDLISKKLTLYSSRYLIFYIEGAMWLIIE